MTLPPRLSRVAVVLAVAAVALLGAAVNLWLLEPHGAAPSPELAAPPPTSAPSTTTTAPSTTAATSAPAPTTGDAGRSYVVGAAGTVWLALVAEQLVVGDIVAAEGWTFEVDEGPDKVEVRFRRGDDELRLEAEVRDGQLQVEIESADELDD